MAPSVSPRSHSAPPHDRQQRRILVADDERDSVLTLEELLRDVGYKTRGVEKASDVMSALEDFNPDAVLLDIAMPEINGWELARMIRARCREKRPLLIALSGVYNKAADRILGRLAGFDHYLSKPYDLFALLELLDHA